MPTVADVVELVSIVELGDIYLYEERGRRIEETASAEDEEPRVVSSLGVGENEAEGSFGLGFRFRIVFDDRQGHEFVADFQARYDLPGPHDISNEIRTEFAERVAFFAVYPYLRASIQMTASRMGVPAPVLSMVRAGEFQLGERMPEEEVTTQFGDTAPEA